MPPWFERDQPTPFDALPIQGRRNLDGDRLASAYRQDWVAGKKYPVIRFPSEAERELTLSAEPGGEPSIRLFGSLQLPFQHTRDEAYEQLVSVAKEHGVLLSREHDRRLRIANPETGRSYLLTFDNTTHYLSNVELFPDYAMDLMPAEIRAVLPPIRGQEAKGFDAIAPVKYFTPDASWTWYATEFDGDDLLFGLVSGYEVEYGYFALSELETVRGRLGLPIERDLYYEPQTLGQIEDYERQLKR